MPKDIVKGGKDSLLKLMEMVSQDRRKHNIPQGRGMVSEKPLKQTWKDEYELVLC